MTYTERINAYTVASAAKRRPQMWLVFTVLWGWALIALGLCVQPLFNPDPRAVAISFAGTVFLGLLTPGLVLLTSAVAGRGPGIWLWVGFAAGGLIIAAAPLLVFFAGGSWDTDVILVSRWRAGERPNPLWMTAVITSGLALVMALPGILGVVRCRRSRRDSSLVIRSDRGTGRCAPPLRE